MILAHWVTDRLQQPGALAVVASTSDEVVVEAIELFIQFGVTRERVSGEWYLSSIKRLARNGSPWWSCTFETPQREGDGTPLFGSLRRVKIPDPGRKIGGIEVPPAPEERTDYLLEASLNKSCQDDDFRPNLTGVTLVTRSNDAATRKSEAASGAAQIAKALRPGSSTGAGVADSRRASEHEPEAANYWWVAAAAGVGLIATGIVIGVRRRA
jgi:hypothetical protein